MSASPCQNCDETHETVHFNDIETASRAPYLARAEELDGRELIIADVRELCSHVGMCQKPSELPSKKQQTATRAALSLLIKKQESL
jgi:hypothetical protein